MINKFSKVLGYKINIQNSVVFLCINNEQLKVETKRTTPFTIAAKRIKYLRINITKKVKYLHTENYKTSKKEIKEHGDNWEDSCVRGF